MSAAKRAWAWLGTYTAFRIISVIACLYFAIASIGTNSSYWAAFNTAAMFFAIWTLGYNSRAPRQDQEVL